MTFEVLSVLLLVFLAGYAGFTISLSKDLRKKVAEFDDKVKLLNDSNLTITRICHDFAGQRLDIENRINTLEFRTNGAASAITNNKKF